MADRKKAVGKIHIYKTALVAILSLKSSFASLNRYIAAKIELTFETRRANRLVNEELKVISLTMSGYNGKKTMLLRLSPWFTYQLVAMFI